MSSEFSWSDHPPQAVVLIVKVVDIICYPFIHRWRDYIPSDWSWIQREYNSYDCLGYPPPLLTYAEYAAAAADDGTDRNFYSLATLYSYAFHTDSTALGLTTTNASLLVMLVLILGLRAIKSVLLPYFSAIGRRAGRHTHGTEWEQNNEIRIVKFGEYVFRLLYHSCISIYGIYYFRNKVWWTGDGNDDYSNGGGGGGTTHLFAGFPFHPIEPTMAWYYLIQSAYNAEAMISLLELSFTVDFWPTIRPSRATHYLPFQIKWRESVRGDFREMFVHHVVTNCLVLGSSYFRFTRIGSMVFMVHDISDIPVDLSKLANFLKWKAATATCFATMVLLWLVLRLGILPFVIFRSLLYESHLVLDTPFVHQDCFVVYQGIFKALFGIIILLHALWFTMFCQMGYILIFKGEAHDLSEHKKGEIDASTTKKKAKGE